MYNVVSSKSSLTELLNLIIILPISLDISNLLMKILSLRILFFFNSAIIVPNALCVYTLIPSVVIDSSCIKSCLR